MEAKEKPVIQINKISLIYSNFTRLLETLEGELKNELDLDIEIQNGDPLFYVTLIVKYRGKIGDTEQMNAEIKMKGEFELLGEKPEFYKDFCNNNAPAIIYPYIREHLASLTNKADLITINLPPFNFISFSQKYSNYLEDQEKS